ncbi:MAG: hypothetical protein ACM37V_04680 [Gemmatimonadota bacterium]
MVRREEAAAQPGRMAPAAGPAGPQGPGPRERRPAPAEGSPDARMVAALPGSERPAAPAVPPGGRRAADAGPVARWEG